MPNKMMTVACAAGVAAVFGMATADQADAKERWKMHSAFPTTTAVIGPVGPRISGWIDEMTDGEFDIKVFEPGAIVGGYAYYDAVSEGALDAAYGTPGANQGKNSAYNFFSTWPFGPPAPEFLAWMLYGGGVELAEELYGKDTYSIPPLRHDPTGNVWLVPERDQKPGRTSGPEDAFLRSRCEGHAEVRCLHSAACRRATSIRRLNSARSTLPSSPCRRSTVRSASIRSPNTIISHGWHQQSTTNEILVNQEKWDGLSDQNKAIFRAACKANIAQEIAEGEFLQADAMAANVADGVTNVQWSQDVLDSLEGAWNEVIAEEIAENEDSKRIWASITDFREKFKIWGEMGYLK